MNKCFALLPLLLLGAIAVAQDKSKEEDKSSSKPSAERSDKELIEQLDRTLEKVLKEQETAEDPNQLAERCKKHAARAEALLQEFEKVAPKSPY